MEIKILNLGTHIDILINNMLGGRNDHLERSGKHSSEIIGRLDHK